MTKEGFIVEQKIKTSCFLTKKVKAGKFFKSETNVIAHFSSSST